MAALRKRSEVSANEGVEVGGGTEETGTRVPHQGSIDRIPREEGTRTNIYPAEGLETNEQHVGEEALNDGIAAYRAGCIDEGQTVEVTIGDKLFQPIQYNGFRVGPFKASTIVRKGETVAKAMLRLHVEMMGAAHKIHDAEAEKYVEDLAALIRKTNGAKL